MSLLAIARRVAYLGLTSMRFSLIRVRSLALSVASFGLLASAISAQTLPLQADRVTARVDAGTPAALSGHMPGWVRTAPDLGPVQATATVDLNIMVARSPQVQAAFDQLVLDQQRPGSPMYHQWLTPQQVGALYGPTQHDLDAVTAWLSASGFQVKGIAANRIMIEASAPAQIVESAFHTQLHTFQVRNGGVLDKVQAPLSEPSVPQALQNVMASIGGLVNLPMHLHSRAGSMPMAGTNIHPRNAAPEGSAPVAPDYTIANGTVHLLAPADFATIYDINPVLNAGTKGTGVKVMIIGGVRLNATDLSAWENLSALPAYQPNYVLGSSFADPGFASSSNDDGEETLDFERVYGTAPGATVDEVIANNWLSGSVNFNLQSYAINTVKDPIMSMSFSACEADQSTAFLAQENTLYQQAASQGISIFASSGDSGADTCENHNQAAVANQSLAISDICASPYVTCVGGTEFNDTANTASYWNATNGTGELSALSYIPEGAWNEPTVTANGATTYVVAATGGGVSTSQAKPAFQTGTGVPPDGHRDVPDVSFSASGHNGYFSCLTSAGANCTNGRLIYFSGTSASAPSMAGVAALIVQKTGTSQGNLNTLLYKVASEGGGAFNDVTPTSSGIGSACSTATPSMCNNSDPSPTGLTGGLAGYPLTVGYDLSTGLGSLDVAKFLAIAALPSPTGTVVASPATITVSQTATFSIALTGSGAAPSGTVQFASNGVNFGSPVTLAGGSATSIAEGFPAAATYAITAAYSGDASYSPTTFGPLQYVVTNPTAVASTSTLTASSSTLTPSQTVTFIDTIAGASGTPTGTAQLVVDGTLLPATANVSGGVATFAPTTLAVGSHSVVARYTGDKIYSASTSSPVTVTVTALTSSTSIVASATATGPQGYFFLTGTVIGVSGGAVPTGSLTAFGQTQGSLGSVNLVNGTVTGGLLGTTTNPLVTDTYYFVYSGDGNYAASQSGNVTVTVTAGFAPTYTLKAANATVSSAAGAAATNTITVTSGNGYSTAIGLSCTATYSGSSSDTIVEPTCSFSPASINLLTDTASNVNSSGIYEASTLTLTTVVPHGKSHAANQGFRIDGAFGGTALAGLILFSIPALRRRRNWNALACVLLLVAAAGISGCGSGGSGSGGGGGGGTTLTGTPSGSYTITVNGTGGVSTTFTLTVQ